MNPRNAVAPVLCVPQWAGVEGLVHGFLGRQGGVSGGAFAHLNLSVLVGDEPTAVETNWQIAARTAVGLDFVRFRQVHGTQVVHASPRKTVFEEADAAIAAEPGVALSILTADCVPILLLAREQRAVAAVHAGWRGTLKGVVDAVVAELQSALDLKPDQLEAALGPAIGSCCYEVDAELAERLAAACNAQDAVADGSCPGKALVDLRQMNASRLRRLGVHPGSIHRRGPCTSCARDEYFSHRAQHGRTGRQLSFIGWQR